MMNIGKREKILIGVVAAMAILFLAERFLFSGVRGKSKGVSQQIKVEESRLKMGLDIQNRKDKIEAEYNQLAPYLEKTQGVPEREISAKFLKEVERVAQEAGVSIVSLSPQEDTQDAADYTQYNAEFRAEGSLAQMLSFVNKVQNSPLLIKLDRMTIASKDERAGALKMDAILALVVPKK